MIASRFTAAFVFGLALIGPASAGTSLVIDASSGAVLSSENASQPWHPASTTKMMTAYLALKAVREGRIGLETAIPASRLAASQPRVKVYIKAGQEVTLDNALRIMMVKSANDIAYVVAEGVGGDVPTFVSMMNAEAARLGMSDTHFVNPNGWHHPDQQVSARDLAILAMALMREFPDAVFMGYRHGEELGALYRSADVLVFPSRTDTFGNVITEALASGTPVAALPVTGPLDVLSDPRAGALHEDLNLAVTRALTLHRDDARRHGERFTWAASAGQLRDALEPLQQRLAAAS